jgi:hypothetical protein
MPYEHVQWFSCTLQAQAPDTRIVVRFGERQEPHLEEIFLFFNVLHEHLSQIDQRQGAKEVVPSKPQSSFEELFG